MSKNTLFQGEKQCLKTNYQKKTSFFRAKCPKTHVQDYVDPNPKKNAHKREKHQNKKRGCEEDHFILAKTVSKQKRQEKAQKTPLQPQGHFSAQSPTRTQHLTHPRAQKFLNFRLPGNLKNAISKQARFCSPKGFLPWKHNLELQSPISHYKTSGFRRRGPLIKLFAGRLLTLKFWKCGPDTHPTIYIYICGDYARKYLHFSGPKRSPPPYPASKKGHFSGHNFVYRNWPFSVDSLAWKSPYPPW